MHRRTAGILGGVRQLRRTANRVVRLTAWPSARTPQLQLVRLPSGLDQQSTPVSPATSPRIPERSVRSRSSTRPISIRANTPAKGVASVLNASGKYTHRPQRRRVGLGLCDPTRQRASSAELQRRRTERLQPVDLQLPVAKTTGGTRPRGRCSVATSTTR